MVFRQGCTTRVKLELVTATIICHEKRATSRTMSIGGKLRFLVKAYLRRCIEFSLQYKKSVPKSDADILVGVAVNHVLNPNTSRTLQEDSQFEFVHAEK